MFKNKFEKAIYQQTKNLQQNHNKCSDNLHVRNDLFYQ